MMYIDFNRHKQELQLESWNTNKYISEDMKNFYKDLILGMQNISSEVNVLKSEIKLMDIYLNNKNSKQDFSDFKRFIGSNSYADELTIKSYFRKKKIENILNG